jgi:hypothetical protein
MLVRFGRSAEERTFGPSLLYFQEDDVVIVKSQDIILSFQRRQGIYSYDPHFGKEREARTHRVQNLLLLVP